MKEPVEWNDKDIEAIRNRTFGNGLLATFPALYGWQVYGWKIGVVTFVLLLAILALIGWNIVLGHLRPSHASWYRAIIVALAFAIIGLSSAELVKY